MTDRASSRDSKIRFELYRPMGFLSFSSSWAQCNCPASCCDKEASYILTLLPIIHHGLPPPIHPPTRPGLGLGPDSVGSSDPGRPIFCAFYKIQQLGGQSEKRAQLRGQYIRDPQVSYGPVRQLRSNGTIGGPRERVLK